MDAGGDMAARIAIIWVHYRTPELLRESVALLVADLPRSVEPELVVVDNGGLDSAPTNTAVLRPQRNVGYAGGINLGVAATRAPNIIVMNPDVLVQPGCVPALINALRSHPIVAPDLYLDRQCRFRMPPVEACDFVSTCIAELGRRDHRWARWARRRWRRHAHRYWRARPDGTAGCHASGAMLGFTRGAYQQLGPWDEGYHLYFEETDWLAHAGRAGLYPKLVADAGAVHLYARSSRKHPHARSWFDRSRARFEHRHFKPWQTALLARIRNRGARSPSIEPGGRVPDVPAWMELSTEACGYPAATSWIENPSGFVLPADVSQQLPARECWLRWLSSNGREVATTRIGRGDHAGGPRV